MTENTLLIEQLQDRIDNLEAKIAFQDDVIEQLNIEITAHQEGISHLKDQLNLVVDKVKSMNASQIANPEDEAPPPHY
ncbi:SlyX family protein [Thalassotalea sp. HSM 43]|uniref:SlyX family protein n=1 Tax=Thalassotalea sp. HSM 43 TaxID=2552945 RepID=UPI001080A100|nr:SlyX family protein [Thalassotalea sp. HSM 43]QBY04005.1 SlyX family protein [Thalassotalea sp. HSM 43]